MTTRRANDDSTFHQNRYASSPEFERGLLANMVAKRVSLLDGKPDRQLVWFLQYLSRQDGGLAAVADGLEKIYPDRFGTTAMVEIGKASSKTYNADEVVRIRKNLPRALRREFPLRDHPIRHYHHSLLDCEQAAKHPTSYPVAVLQELCHRAAKEGIDCQVSLGSSESNSLEKELCRLCLDPEWNLADGGPWYFSDLVNTLREYHKQWVEQKSGAVVTGLGKKVCEILDYTLYSRSLSLMEGTARTGKSFAARAWCLQHPGQARFVEVPPGNDESGFLRALARGLGTGSSLNYKLGDLKERVASVLLTGDLLLVLDEAQRLWPTNLRHCFPHRINWVMAMTNAGVPICMVSTPQFVEWQKSAEEKGGWNSAQLTGRIGHYELLPADLDAPDLMAVAKAVLPEAGNDVLRALAVYARTSARYLAAVDSIVKRAKFLAQRAGRTECNAGDVRTAMQESVIPSDTRSVRTLESTRKNKSGRGRTLALPEESVAAPAEETFAGRIKPCRSSAPTRPAELIPG